MQEVARQAGVSRPAVWRWQQRYGEDGVEGLLHDKTRPPGKEPLPTETVAEVLALTCSEPPGEVIRPDSQMPFRLRIPRLRHGSSNLRLWVRRTCFAAMPRFAAILLEMNLAYISISRGKSRSI